MEHVVDAVKQQYTSCEVKGIASVQHSRRHANYSACGGVHENICAFAGHMHLPAYGHAVLPGVHVPAATASQYICPNQPVSVPSTL
jgi:hypothetical protein